MHCTYVGLQYAVMPLDFLTAVAGFKHRINNRTQAKTPALSPCCNRIIFATILSLRHLQKTQEA